VSAVSVLCTRDRLHSYLSVDWIVDALVGDDYFASGGFKYLKQVLRWCKQSSLFVVLDLHSLPGIAAHEESFAGRIVDKPDFFNEGNYDKAYQVLKNLTISAHTDEDFSTGESALFMRCQRS
jgi:hypothetical protein